MLRVSLLSKKSVLECPLAGLRLGLARSSDSLRVRSTSIASTAWRAYSSVQAAEKSTPETHAKRRWKKYHRVIRTLDPARLTPDDYVDFSSTIQPNIHVAPRSTDIAAGSSALRIFSAAEADWGQRGFPPGMHGFLYYHVPPHAPPLAGELRFRVTPSSDPAGFATGSDLLTDRGLPWRYPLYKILAWSDSLVALLLQDGLVSQRTLDLAAAAAGTSVRWKQATAQRMASAPASMLPMLNAFGQEFVYPFEQSHCWCLFVGPETIIKQDLWFVARFQVRVDEEPVKYCPFEGSVVCAFERSTLPQHAGKRVVVIRVKRCIDVKRVPAPNGQIYPDALIPREGEILSVMSYKKVRPWAVDVDKGGKIGRALRVFFENEELYGSWR